MTLLLLIIMLSERTPERELPYLLITVIIPSSLNLPSILAFEDERPKREYYSSYVEIPDPAHPTLCRQSL